jgi:hypothetical protein
LGGQLLTSLFFLPLGRKVISLPVGGHTLRRRKAETEANQPPVIGAVIAKGA